MLRMRMVGSEWPACPREDCADYGERRKENVRLYHRYGSGEWILFRCRTCGRSFSERQWTPFFRLQIPERKAVEIVRVLALGYGIRETARQVEVDKNTVMRILEIAIKHNRWFQATLARELIWDSRTIEKVSAFLRERARLKARKQTAMGRLIRPS